MTNDLTALLAPIAEKSPAGLDVTGTNEFERMKIEIDTLADPLSGRQPDWIVVAEAGKFILSNQSKDFIVAARVAAAWCVLSELPGLADSAKLLTGLVQTYWADGYPNLKRVRGRRNAIAWWIERVTQWLDSAPLEPVEPDFYQTLLTVLQETSSALSSADPEAPALRSLIDRVSRIDVIEPPLIEPSTEVGAVDQANTTGAGPDNASQTSSTTDSLLVTNGIRSTQTVKSSITPMGGTGCQLGNLANISNVEAFKEVLSPVMQYLGEAGPKLLELQAFNPMGLQLTRFGARGTLLNLPTAQGSVTRLPAPSAADLATLAVIQASGNADGMISFCEGRLARYPFWLDLDRHSSQAYASLGPKAAVMRQTVVIEALSFAQRLEGVELLSFANNMPFASDETRAWLKSCENERSGGNAADGFGQVRHEAMQAFNAGSAEAAVKILQAYATHAASGFDLFRTKLVIAELAVSMRKDIDQRPFVEPLSDQCTRLSLSSWDSELALDVWRLKLRAARHAMTLVANTQVPSRLLALESEVAQALMQISEIDMQEAIRLA